jgi:hypothetical protein
MRADGADTYYWLKERSDEKDPWRSQSMSSRYLPHHGKIEVRMKLMNATLYVGCVGCPGIPEQVQHKDGRVRQIDREREGRNERVCLCVCVSRVCDDERSLLDPREKTIS